MKTNTSLTRARTSPSTILPMNNSIRAAGFVVGFSRAFLIFSSFCLLPSAFPQGSLTPPGAPAPLMKTLQQIEPRIDLQNAPASAVTTSNASYHFIITQPGSYYLSANLGVTKLNGIQISVPDVTLDLNGFHISRASGTGGSGIEIHYNGHRSSLRNGSIRGFAQGIDTLSSAGDTAHGCAFRELAVSFCSVFGIQAGEFAILESCHAGANSGTAGIQAGFGSTLTNCTASRNLSQFGIDASNNCTLINCAAIFNRGATGTAGIRTADDCTIIHCTADSNTGAGMLAGIGALFANCAARENTGDGFTAGDGSALKNCVARVNDGDGIDVGSGAALSNCVAEANQGEFGITVVSDSVLTHCVARDNTSASAISAGISLSTSCVATDCVSSGNTSTAATPSAASGMGIVTSIGCAIRNCVTRSNGGDGIRVSSDCVVQANTADSNGSVDGAGIHVTASDTRIEGNNVTDNDRGIDVDIAGCLIIRNSASGNGSNYEIVAGNAVGSIVVTGASVAISGDGPFPSSLTSTDSTANYSF